MREIVDILSKDLDYELRNQVVNRYKIMVSHYDYLKNKKDINLFFTYKYKWDDSKYKTLFALNSFYQMVLGPIVTSAYAQAECGLGRKIPIKHGSMMFDRAHSRRVFSASNDFNKIVKSCGFNDYMLAANKTSDLVYHIAKIIRSNNPDE